MTADSWRASRSRRIQARLIALAGHPVIAALGATYRWRVNGGDVYQRVLASGRQPILVFWHGRILPAAYFFRHRNIVVIISDNFDGEWIANIIQKFGYGTARGSTSRGAVKALLHLKREMAAGKPAGFALDGPRGPARVAQAGAIWLAKITGNPIIPFHFESKRHWTARSWDGTQIPKPFSDVALAIGEPFDVPPDADDEAIESRRRDLERELTVLESRAQGML